MCLSSYDYTVIIFQPFYTPVLVCVVDSQKYNKVNEDKHSGCRGIGSACFTVSSLCHLIHHAAKARGEGTLSRQREKGRRKTQKVRAELHHQTSTNKIG